MSNKSILFLLDESSSMSIVRDITIGGFNAWRRTLELIENDVRVTLTSFYNHETVHFDHIPARKLPPLTTEQYSPRGMTALYDTIVKEMARVNRQHMRPGDTALVIILTDGDDSHFSTTAGEAKEKIDFYRRKGWTFLYLSSADAYLEYASRIGIGPESCVYFNVSDEGTEKAYQEITRASMSFANGEEESLETWAPIFEQQLKESGNE